MAIKLQIDFTDPELIPYKIEIGDPTYTGTFIRQVNGSATLEYPKVKTMDMLRGSVLKMQLEATLDSSYYRFLYETVGDAQLPVTLYRDGQLFWKGFIKPDGIVESFVNDRWYISVQAIDGLGYLENTSFLDDKNEPFTGSYSELELITRCLQLTGQTLDFRLYDFNIFFTVNEQTAPEITNRPITKTYVNTDRYKQKDNSKSVFSVKDVLESVLKKYGAYVVQDNGKWNIIRLIDYFSKETDMRYFEYDYTGTYTDNTEAPDRQITLGSQINGFYPHHANANQQKYYNVALGAYKVLYEYGFVESILSNTNLLFNDDDGNIDDWTVNPVYASELTYERDGLKYVAKWNILRDENFTVLNSDINPRVSLYDILNINANIDFNVPPRSITEHRAFITLIGDSGTVYYLDDASPANWSLEQKAVRLLDFETARLGRVTGSQIFEVQTADCPESGVINVNFLLPSYNGDYSGTGDPLFTRINSFSITGKELNVEGESFTSTRGVEVVNGRTKTTTVIDTNDDIYVGDNESDLYIGAIEDVDANNTVSWSKKIVNGGIDISKRYYLLDWLTRDRLTISSGNSLTFSGGVYGYIPYLGVISIDNIGTGTEPQVLHKFMTSSWSYNLASNINTVSYERIFQDDISEDIKATGRVLEGVTVVRPLVVG